MGVSEVVVWAVMGCVVVLKWGWVADVSGILGFADGLSLVVCGALFVRQGSRLVACVAGPVGGAVGSVTVRQGDEAGVRDIGVVPGGGVCQGMGCWLWTCGLMEQKGGVGGLGQGCVCGGLGSGYVGGVEAWLEMGWRERGGGALMVTDEET